MNKVSDIKYIKYNRVVIESSKNKYKVVDMFKDFFTEIKEKIKGLQGFTIMIEDTSNINNDNMSSIIIVQTFWKDKQDMDVYYKDNKDLSELVKRTTPFLKYMPERIDYTVSEFVI